jgi:hypothetical protein
MQMSGFAHSEVAIETARGRERCRQLNPDTVPEAASFNEPTPLPNGVWPYVLDDHTLEAIFGGAGI